MDDSKTSDQEVFESIPWEELRDLGDTSRRRRVWYLTGGAALVAVLVFSVVRTFSAPDPGIDAAAVTAAVPTTITAIPPAESTLTQVPSTETLPSFSEADLRADGGERADGDGLVAQQAGAYGEWFVQEFFSLDGTEWSPAIREWLPEVDLIPPPESLSYVEWARTVQAEPHGDGRWRMVVLLRRLVSADGVTYSRLPTQAIEVVMDMGLEVPAIVDLPRFVPVPETTPARWWLGEPSQAPPAHVIRGARDELLLSGAGTPAGEPLVSRTGDVWRVQWAVVDTADISWPVSMWFGPDGAPVPAGG